MEDFTSTLFATESFHRSATVDVQHHHQYLPSISATSDSWWAAIFDWLDIYLYGSMLGVDASQAIVASYVDSFYSISAPIGAILTWHLSSWASSFPCHHPVLSSFQDHSHFGLRLRWGAPPRGVCFVVQRKREEELPNIRRLIWCRDGVYLWWTDPCSTGVYRLMLISVVWNPLFHAIMGRDCWLGELF